MVEMCYIRSDCKAKSSQGVGDGSALLIVRVTFGKLHDGEGGEGDGGDKGDECDEGDIDNDNELSLCELELEIKDDNEEKYADNDL